MKEISKELCRIAKEITSEEKRYMKKDKRSLWIKLRSNPISRMTIEEANKEAKRMDKLMQAQLKKIEKLTDAYLGESVGEEVIDGNEQYKWVSKTALLGVRGLEEAERLYSAIDELGYEEGIF